MFYALNCTLPDEFPEPILENGLGTRPEFMRTAFDPLSYRVYWVVTLG